MSRRDGSHFSVRRALEKDDWTITSDPLTLFYEGVRLKADMGAERSFAAEKKGRKIAVEVKEFSNDSIVSELEKTVGQLQFYQWALDEQEPERELFMALSEAAYQEKLTKPLFQIAITRNKINLLIFDHVEEVILRWIRA